MTTAAQEVSAVEIIAHRGASAYEPENTLRAVKRAWEMNADATEIDIHLTKDGKIAVMHDKTVDRTTTAKGSVLDRTLDELQTLNIRWNDKVYEDEFVPSLEQVLEIIPAGKRVFIESKVGPEIVPELNRVIAASKLEPEQIVIISFNIDTMRESKKAMRQYKHYYLAERKDNTFDAVLQRAKDAECDGVNLSVEWPVSGEMVERAKEAGLDTYVWTIREKQSLIAAGLASMGVAGLTTDFPDKCRDWIKPTKLQER